jgi:transposase
MLFADESKVNKNNLLRMYRNCKDGRMKERYQAVLLSFDRHDIPEIAKVIYRDESTVREWIKAFNEGGLEGLKRNAPSGRLPSLNEEQLNHIKDVVRQSPRNSGYNFANWTCKLVSDLIQKVFNIRFTIERARQMLHQLGFRLVKPSHFFIKRKERERLEFVIRMEETIKNLDGNTVLLFQDESIFKQHPSLAAMWTLKGERPMIATYGSHVRRGVFGAVSPLSGIMMHRLSKKVNAKEFLVFLVELLETYPGKKLIVVLDNARWHKSKSVKEFECDNKHRLELIFQPAYSPDLNPIELLWKQAKKTVTHNSFFPTIDLMANAIDNFFTTLAKTPQKVMQTCSLKSLDYLFG